MDKLMEAQRKGIKLIPCTKGERNLVEMLKNCDSMERCNWIYVHILQNRSHLRTQIGQMRAWTLFIDSAWGEKWLKKDYKDKAKRYVKDVAQRKKKGDYPNMHEIFVSNIGRCPKSKKKK